MKLPRRKFLHWAAGAAALPAASRIARAQAYPSRPLTLTVFVPAGGTPDIIARLVGQAMSQRLGQSVVIENRPAARGLSLRVDWMRLRSFADRFEPCMTGGGAHDGDELRPWSHFGSSAEASAAGAFQLRQDVDALYRMLPVWMGEFLRHVDEGRIDPLGTG